MEDSARRIAVMQTIEEVKGQMRELRQLLDDIETVIATQRADDDTVPPLAPEEIGMLIRQLAVLRLRLERLAR